MSHWFVCTNVYSCCRSFIYTSALVFAAVHRVSNGLHGVSRDDQAVVFRNICPGLLPAGKFIPMGFGLCRVWHWTSSGSGIQPT